MTATNSAKEDASQDAPAVVLVKAQMGENIGAAARAMMNFGLSRLTLVAPRDGWPSEPAQAMAAGALEIMPPVPVFADTASSLTGHHYVYATTARPRDMAKPVLDAKTAAADMRTRIAGGQSLAILFGGERSGLDNDDIALAHSIITIPANPGFSSINLAQGVMLVAYEWFQSGITADKANSAARRGKNDNLPARHEELLGLYERLETALEGGNFFRSGGQKPIMVRNLRAMLARADLTEQEVRTFHGIISALTGKKNPLDRQD